MNLRASLSLLSAAALFAGVAASFVACDANKNTEFTFAVTTDLDVPKDFNVVCLSIARNGTTLQSDCYEVSPSALRLPATLGVAAVKDDSKSEIDVKAYAYHLAQPSLASGAFDSISLNQPLALRHVHVQFSSGQNLLVPLPLNFACYQFNTAVADPTFSGCGSDNLTCVEGECASISRAASQLDLYSDELVFGGTAPATTATPYGACWDPGKCLTVVHPLPVSFAGGDAGSCSVDLTGVSLARERVTLTLRHHLSSQLGFCVGGNCWVPLDLVSSLSANPDGGYAFTDGSKNTAQLAPGICRQLKIGRIDGVDATDVCAFSKTSATPICDINATILGITPVGTPDASAEGGDGSSSSDAGSAAEGGG